jgi:hypothetical protein
MNGQGDSTAHRGRDWTRPVTRAELKIKAQFIVFALYSFCCFCELFAFDSIDPVCGHSKLTDYFLTFDMCSL